MVYGTQITKVTGANLTQQTKLWGPHIVRPARPCSTYIVLYICQWQKRRGKELKYQNIIPEKQSLKPSTKNPG
jgi:hypothetical protein